MFTVYILKSEKTGKYYIGYTSDLVKRLHHHNSGWNLSTKTGRPWKLIKTEIFPSKQGAWLREHQIKKYKNGEAFKKLLEN